MQREVSAGCRCCRRSFRLHLIQDPLHLLSSSLSLSRSGVEEDVVVYAKRESLIRSSRAWDLSPWLAPSTCLDLLLVSD